MDAHEIIARFEREAEEKWAEICRKSKALLYRYLSFEEKRMLEEKGYIIVKRNGRAYQLRFGLDRIRTFAMDGNVCSKKICVDIPGVPLAEKLLGLKFALEAMDDKSLTEVAPLFD